MSIEGSITALVTPMNEKGDLDYNSLEKLINFQIDSGISGLVAVCLLYTSDAADD